MLSLFIFIAATNYVFETKKLKFEETMANMQIAGETIYYKGNYDERMFQKLYIEKLSRKTPELIVIGSSRGMQINSELVGFVNMYNNCVSGATIEDMYAIIGLYNKKIIPEAIVIEVSPWNLSDSSNMEKRFEVLEESIRELERIIGHKNIWLDVFYKFRINRISKLLSLQNFYYLFTGSFFQVNEISKTKHDPAFYTKFSDGSISYSDAINNRIHEELMRIIKAQPFYEAMIGIGEISKAKVKQFEDLLLWLTQKNIKITLFLSPFPPLVYDSFMDEKYRTAVSEIEKYLQNVAKTNAIEIRGTYNPHAIGAKDSDFYDSYHIKKEKHEILWGFISK
jgi:hypothetical protein